MLSIVAQHLVQDLVMGITFMYLTTPIVTTPVMLIMDNNTTSLLVQMTVIQFSLTASFTFKQLKSKYT
jgi:hypothetical protein